MAKLTTKFKSLKKTTKVDFATYLGVIAVFIVVTVLQNGGMLNRKTIGLLVPICCYMSMAVSLNLTVGILGELSLGHAGFMSVGAFSGVIVSQSLLTAVPNAPVRLAIAMVVGAIFAAIVGLLVGTPVLRLQGDYLAIVTLAFGEIIADLINCLLVGYDASGLHILFNVSGTKTIDDLGLDATGYAIIKGAQGATGTKTIAGLTAGFILVMVTLIIVLNLTRSRAGRAIKAIRDNEIAAESCGIQTTYYKVMAFAFSAAFAGLAGGLYACYLGVLDPSTFGFMKSIEILVMVVLGGMGSMLGSILSATVLTILPEATRSFDSYRMVIYSLVLILMMIFRPGGLLGSYDFSMSRIVEKVMNGELFHKKNADKEGADHE